MAKNTTKKKSLSLKKWQKSAVKLGYYTTKEIRQIKHFADLTKEQQHQIRITWTPQYKQRRSFEAHQKAINTRKINTELRKKRDDEDTRRIEEFIKNTPPPFDSSGYLNTDRYLTDVVADSFTPKYLIIDKETGEIVGEYRVILQDRKGNYTFAPIDENGIVGTDKSKFKTQEQLALEDYQIYTHTPDSGEILKETANTDPSQGKTVDDYIEDKINEILDEIRDPTIKDTLASFIDEVRSKDGDENIRQSDGTVNQDFFDNLSEFAEKAIYYEDDEALTEYYIEIYQRLTGKDPSEEMMDLIMDKVSHHSEQAELLREERAEYRRQNMAALYEHDQRTNPRTGAPREVSPSKEQIIQNVIKGILNGDVTYSRSAGTKLVKK